MEIAVGIVLVLAVVVLMVRKVKKLIAVKVVANKQ